MDFLITGHDGVISLLQVSTDLHEPATRQRELKALTEAMQECKLRQAAVVTMNDEEKLETEAGQIRILPAWLWALRVS